MKDSVETSRKTDSTSGRRGLRGVRPTRFAKQEAARRRQLITADEYAADQAKVLG